MVDDRDPAAHWAMGRALWLRGKQDQSITELERAVDLSPNYATAHYTLAFVHAQSGDPHAAISFSDHSRHLSPFDPLLFAMLGARSMGLARLGQYEEAAEWAIKAAARPNAHQHIMAIAAFTLGLAGRVPEAHEYTEKIRERVPDYRLADFLAAFRYSPDAAAMFTQAAGKIGIVVSVSPIRADFGRGRAAPESGRLSAIDAPSTAVIYWPRQEVRMKTLRTALILRALLGLPAPQARRSTFRTPAARATRPTARCASWPPTNSWSTASSSAGCATHYPCWNAEPHEFMDIGMERYAVVYISSANTPGRRIYFRVQSRMAEDDEAGFPL